MKPIKATILWTLAAGIDLPENGVARYFELMMLRCLLRELEINCVLDVGANRGQFASELRGIGYKGSIISFEPQAGEFAAMQQRFKGDRLWRGFQIALGARDGEVDFHVVEKMPVLSSVLAPKGTAVKVEKIKIRRLDSIFPEVVFGIKAPRVFLKMDTQGYDLEVFRGAVACRDMLLGLQSELAIQPLYDGMPHYRDALSTYEAAGFELFNIAAVSRDVDRGLQEINCFMRRRSTLGER